MLTLTDNNFKETIASAAKVVLVDFWATWCAPCSALAPILEKVVEEMEDKIILAKVNVDEAPIISGEFNVDRIPTVILFKEGKAVENFIGIKTEEEIREWIIGKF